jgi:hypothetical protein
MQPLQNPPLSSSTVYYIPLTDVIFLNNADITKLTKSAFFNVENFAKLIFYDLQIVKTKYDKEQLMYYKFRLRSD